MFQKCITTSGAQHALAVLSEYLHLEKNIFNMATYMNLWFILFRLSLPRTINY